MATKHVLTDVESGIWVEAFELPDAPAGCSVRKRTLRGGRADGVDVIDVCNGPLSFTILPTRGMGIWRGDYRGTFLGWKAPVTGPVHPKYVNLTDRGGLGWLQGFDELIVRCGLESNGAPCTDIGTDNNGNPTPVQLPLHGRIANSPAHKVCVEVSGDEITVSGTVEEAALFTPNLRLETRISTKAGSNSLTVSDEVTNLRGTDAELQLLYHVNLGAPLLEEGAMLLAPAKEVAPRDPRAAEDVSTYRLYRRPTPGYVEQVYWYELAADASGQTLAALRNVQGDKAAVLRFNKHDLPCFAQWKNTQAENDGYVTGLEPATNFPNPKPFERQQRRVVKLSPGNIYRATLTLEVLDSADAVAALEREIAELSGGSGPQVHENPKPGWSQIAPPEARIVPNPRRTRRNR
jgi:Domain of unknown function (DUF4432)